MRAVAQSIHRLNPGVFVGEQHDFAWVLDNQGWATERFLASIFALFAVLALLLAATGIYSVISYTVSQRTREFGVRMALGAQRASVIRLVLQASLMTVAVGAVIGIVLSLSLSKFIATSSHATIRDPLMLAGVSALLLAATALACLYPAWRAASIDPNAIPTPRVGSHTWRGTGARPGGRAAQQLRHYGNRHLNNRHAELLVGPARYRGECKGLVEAGRGSWR